MNVVEEWTIAPTVLQLTNVLVDIWIGHSLGSIPAWPKRASKCSSISRDLVDICADCNRSAYNPG